MSSVPQSTHSPAPALPSWPSGHCWPQRSCSCGAGVIIELPTALLVLAAATAV